MRSRFSAYALKLADYIIETTHPASPQYLENKRAWKKSILQFSKLSDFKGLEILNCQEKGKMASISFRASIRQGEKDASFTEHSIFECFASRYLYLEGERDLLSQAPLKRLPLAYYGDPFLRKKAALLGDISPDVNALSEGMLASAQAARAFTLAGAQVKQSLALFISCFPEEEARVFLNPKVLWESEALSEAKESSPSILGVDLKLARPKEVLIAFTALDQSSEERKFSGLKARYILQAIDQLNGVLFVDRLSKKERAKLAPFLKSLKKRMQV